MMTLDALAEHPERARTLTREQACDLQSRAVVVLAALIRFNDPAPAQNGASVHDDELLSVPAGARLMGMSSTTLKGLANQPGFRELFVDNGTRRRLLSRNRIQAFLARR